MSRRTDLTNYKFGRLTAIRPVPNGNTKNGSAVWGCICSCGNELEVPSYALLRGRIRSCGCLLQQNRDAHRKKPGGLTMRLSETNEFDQE